MTRIVSCFLYALTPLLFSAQVAKIKFFYGGIELSSPGKLPVTQIGPGREEMETLQIQTGDFRFKAPALGFGFLMRKKNLFFSADVFYWWGVKKIKYNYSYETKNLMQSFKYNGTYGNPGDNFYRVFESFEGNVNLHYLDFTLNAGKTLGKYLSLFLGFRINALVGQKIDGTLYKSGSEYTVNESYNIVWIPGSNFDIRYKDNQVKKRNGQVLKGSQYLCFGLNSLLKFGERNGFIQLDFGYPVFHNLQIPGRIAYFNLKTGIALFKNKATKELQQ